MDISTLHTVTEELAVLLSEVTSGELRQPVPGPTRDVGDLYLSLIDQNVSVAATITGDTLAPAEWPDSRNRTELDVPVDCFGACGLDSGYRRSARLMENAFASTSEGGQSYPTESLLNEVELTTLYETQISDTVIHTWDLARALGFSYRPIAGIARRVLWNIVLRSRPSSPDARPEFDATVRIAGDDDGIFESVLTLAGRGRGLMRSCNEQASQNVQRD